MEEHVCSLSLSQGASASKNFWNYPAYTHMVWPRVTKFAMVTCWGEVCVSNSQPRPYSKGRGSSISTIFRTCMHLHSMRNSKQILHVDQTRCEDNSYRVSHAVCRCQHFWFMHLTGWHHLPPPSFLATAKSRVVWHCECCCVVNYSWMCTCSVT